MRITQSRRQFLTILSLAGSTNLLRLPRALAGDGALETTTVRLASDPGVCSAALYAAADLLRAEGFTDIRYPKINDTALSMRRRVERSISKSPLSLVPCRGRSRPGCRS